MKTYQVRHYQQSIDNSEQYDLAETETVTAKTGEHLTLAVKAYEGFTAPKPVSYDVVDDGEVTYVDYKYTRDRHQVTIHYNNGNDSETKELAYGEKWEEKPYRAGYVFAGWYTDAEFKKAFDGVVPARDITLYAKWDVQSVNYTIKHCLQNANDDGYSLGAQENFNADTDTVVTPEVKNFDGFTAPKKQQVTVEGDGRTTVIYRYTRNVHTLTLKNYDGKTDKTVEARYEMSIPKPTRAGYAFAGWYTDAKCTKEYKANMPDQDPNAKTQTADDTGEKPTGIRIPGYPSITIEADKKDVQMNLMNPEGNPCYFTFEIVLNDTDETIYTSKMVEP